MASTLAPIRALEYAKTAIKSMPLERIQTRLLDDINKTLWMAAPWRWTVGTLTAITLLSDTSDYVVAPPADFLYLMSAYIADGSNTPIHLEVVPSIPSSMIVVGIPQFISYQGTNTFRVTPRPGTLISPTKTIVCYYKKIAPVLTASNIYTAGSLIMDDEHFHVYEAGVLWAAYMYGDDQRAGTANVDGTGKWAFTGQRATFEAAVSEMKSREPLPVYDARTSRDIKEVA